MPFKVKDLMVDVTSAVGGIQQCYPTFICHFGCTVWGYSGCYYYPTWHTGCHFPCSLSLLAPAACQQNSMPVVNTCPGSLVTDTTPIIQTTPQFSGPVLANLKAQLTQALAAAEKQTAVESEALKPQTLADVEMLETKMGEALGELRARKAELNKK